MGEDTPFLRAIHAAPDDRLPRLVYADWLDDRGAADRAAYLRLWCELAGDPDATSLRRRVGELRAGLPAAWLGALGDHRTAGAAPDPARIGAAARALGRPARFVDPSGYEHRLVAAAPHPFDPAVAYVECRSREDRSGYVDVEFMVRVRRGGEQAAWPVETYNPYFGCDVRFLGWYGEAAVAVYREKHRTYACRFGLTGPPAFRAVQDWWVLDGGQLGYWGHRDEVVRRLAVPGLDDLPPLAAEAAAARDLLPRRSW